MKIVRYHQPAAAALAPLYGFAGRNPVVALEREFDQLFNNTLGDLFTFAPDLAQNRAGGFAVDLYEDKDNTYVRAELPGVDRKDINVEMVDDYLTISGSRKAFGTDGKETESVEFSRSITVPEAVQADKIAAAYENGVLTVTLPKRPEARADRKTIPIEAK